jgi:hypothetical protein
MSQKTGHRFSLATNAERVCAEIVLNPVRAKSRKHKKPAKPTST